MATPADRIGQIIGGKYELTQVLGSGGMGAVYAATNLRLKQDVALKVIESGDSNVIDRFGREARTLSQLSHPNTISVVDFGRDEGVLYLAMEKLEGYSLEEALSRYRRFSAFDAVSVAQQIAASLTEAHDAGIVHRDIKPANIFLSRGQDAEYFVKVLDFGIAKTFGDNAETKLTREGSLVGTPRYMAPEQIRTQQVDQRSDIYALACVLYEMLAGRPPFMADNMADLLIQHLKDNVPPLSRFVPADELRYIPPDLDSVIHRALAKDPRMRQQTMEEFCRDLELALRQMEGGKPVESQSTVSLEIDAPNRRASPSRVVKKSKLPVVVAGISLGLVAVVVAYVAQRGAAVAGDFCEEEGAVVCGESEFGSMGVLGCRNGRLATLDACGAMCEQVLVGGATCGLDEPTMAIEGGYCNVADASACSAAKDSALKCEGLKWVVVRSCAPLACEKKGGLIQCQNNTYSVDDDCDFGKDIRACSADFTQLLACDRGHIVVEEDCSATNGRCTELFSGELHAISCYAFEQEQQDE